MASSWCLSMPLKNAAAPPATPSPLCLPTTTTTSPCAPISHLQWTYSPSPSLPMLRRGPRPRPRHVVCMAPQEERATRRSPADFPIEWVKPKPARRPDIFPKFSPMKTPLPHPMPTDPPLEVEEDEDEERDEEANPEEENPEEPDKSEPQIQTML